MTMATIDFQTLANAGFPPARYAPGEIIFAAGDKGDNMYVIRSGGQDRRDPVGRGHIRRDGPH